MHTHSISKQRRTLGAHFLKRWHLEIVIKKAVHTQLLLIAPFENECTTGGVQPGVTEADRVD
jgi:hypothetical protein